MTGPVKDTSQFPDPVYKETVLSDLFEGVKANYAGHMAAINKAHLVMLSETGILQPDQVKPLAAALFEIDDNVDVASLVYTGEHEDYFFYVEALLRRKLGDLGGMLHTARSRNDMDHTLFKLALRTRMDRLWGEAENLARTFIHKAEREAETLIVAYTHGQPAQPSTFGHYLCAALEVLLRDMERLALAIDTIDHCPMGAAAITTTGFPIDRQRMAVLLGFETPVLNSYGCIASVDYVTGLYSALKLVYVHLGRLIQDLAFWSSFEVGQLYVPNSFVQISSIMPQKRNPVPIEHMRHLSAVTAGRCDVMVDTMRNTPFTDMNDSEGEVQQAGYATFESGSRVLRLLAAFVSAARIDEDRVRKNADAACVTITELADTLVRDEGLSFRQAHEIAAATSKGVLAEETSLREGFNHFKAAFAQETGRDPRLSSDDYRTAVSPERFVSCRDRLGGPAPQALRHALVSYRDQLAALASRQSARRQRYDAAAIALDQTFSSLLET
ncbi:argininosuccinate lyase [Roseibium porphyridii]|uniref:Argininosuccinate lyase n=1 Tax=Roseibium porphyridii TaxID=2866279 RepID=A0ABY8F8U2_9HYPH|nr:argininosuccinate lyase [Roseibium sp. KMA01]WFE91174.1 argininosuccinate lyase [Roseibium sp. KMA01]